MNALEKIIARKKTAAEKNPAVDQPSGDDPSPANQLAPCPTCHSAIRWLNAAGTPRCIGCHPPKIKALVRSREILVCTTAPGKLGDGTPIEVPVRRWETLIEIRNGPTDRLASRSTLGPGGAVACGLASASDLTEAELAATSVAKAEAKRAAAVADYDRFFEISDDGSLRRDGGRF